MTLSDSGLALLQKLEGYRPEAYRDAAGVPTIGYGTTAGVAMGDCCTREQAAEWLARDVAHAAAAVAGAVAIPLEQNQFDALVLFAYNVGTGAFRQSTLLRKLNAGDVDGAAAEFARWDHAGSRVVLGLRARRLVEQALFLSAAVD